MIEPAPAIGDVVGQWSVVNMASGWIPDHTPAVLPTHPKTNIMSLSKGQLGPIQLATAVVAAAAVSYGVYKAFFAQGRKHSLESLSHEQKQAVESLRGQYLLSEERLRKIMKDLDQEMSDGLEVKGKGALKMIPTYVHTLPKGDERGTFLAIDLGGRSVNSEHLSTTLFVKWYSVAPWCNFYSNFRVLSLELDGQGGCSIESNKFELDERHMQSDAGKLLSTFRLSMLCFFRNGSTA